MLIAGIFVDNYEVYGARKIKAALKREHGIAVDRTRVTRLMCELDIRGAARTRSVRTTRPDKSSPRAPDLVKRQFTAERPNELWVSDFTYVPTWSGFAYVAFIIDVYSRFVVGWRVSSSMTTDLVMDALEMAVFNRRTQLISDAITHCDDQLNPVNTPRFSTPNASPRSVPDPRSGPSVTTTTTRSPSR